MDGKLDDHVHSIGPNSMKCSKEGCDFVLVIPPISFSIDVFNKSELVVNDGFSTDSYATVVARLRQIADDLSKKYP